MQETVKSAEFNITHRFERLREILEQTGQENELKEKKAIAFDAVVDILNASGDEPWEKINKIARAVFKNCEDQNGG